MLDVDMVVMMMMMMMHLKKCYGPTFRDKRRRSIRSLPKFRLKG